MFAALNPTKKAEMQNQRKYVNLFQINSYYYLFESAYKTFKEVLVST
jgi:ribosomal protein L15E